MSNNKGRNQPPGKYPRMQIAAEVQRRDNQKLVKGPRGMCPRRCPKSSRLRLEEDTGRTPCRRQSSSNMLQRNQRALAPRRLRGQSSASAFWVTGFPDVGPHLAIFLGHELYSISFLLWLRESVNPPNPGAQSLRI